MPVMIAVGVRGKSTLSRPGRHTVAVLAGGRAAWSAAGGATEAAPGEPPDGERIDFLFHTYRRQNDEEHARQYLSWETGLVDQLDDQERASFRIAAA